MNLYYISAKPVSVIIRNSSETAARMSLIFHSKYLLNSRIMFGIRNAVIVIHFEDKIQRPKTSYMRATCCWFNNLRSAIGLFHIGLAVNIDRRASVRMVGRPGLIAEGPRVTHILGIVVVNLRGALGNTLYWVLLLVWCEASGKTHYWVLLLVYVGPRATLYWVLVYVPRATLYWVLLWFMWGLRQHTLLGIIVDYVPPRATHFTGYCCRFMRGLGQHILLGVVVGYARFWATHFSGHH
jgi:hypothetical protein